MNPSDADDISVPLFCILYILGPICVVIAMVTIYLELINT